MNLAKSILFAALVPLLLVNGAVLADDDTVSNTISVSVFQDNIIHFSLENPAKYDTNGVTAEDNGRVIARRIQLPMERFDGRITAHVRIKPIPKDEITVFDRWDRAGDIRLAIEGQPDIQLVKFITSYGGETSHEVDITDLAPLLVGERTIKAFVDTWVTPAWKVDFSLAFAPDSMIHPADWAMGAMYEGSFDHELELVGGEAVTIEIPADLSRVILKYFVSGHCTDGRDADEFITKDNVISVDDVVVYRFRPWRDDCKDFRPVNPYTRRWSDGYWSSDFNRSGWCPGDIVLPLELDLTDHLTPGEHLLRFMVEDVRPKDSTDHYGYWRLSSYIVGWRD